MANMFYHPGMFVVTSFAQILTFDSLCLFFPFLLYIYVVGIILYYFFICLYLYGDLAIYAVAIPKSLVTVVW